MSPFHPFFTSLDSQRLSHQNPQNQILRAVPTSSFRTPFSTNEYKGNQRVSEMHGGEREESNSQKKKQKGKQDGGSASADVNEDKLVDDILKSINPLDTLNEPNSDNKDSVAYTLMKDITKSQKKGIMELCVVGLHAPSMSGIDCPVTKVGLARVKNSEIRNLNEGILHYKRVCIEESWVEKGKSGFYVFKYKLVRLPGQPEGYMIWKSIKQWTDKSTLRPGLILPDLTSGEENLPVCLVNDADDEKGPACFTYCHTLKNLKPIIHPVEPSKGCNCIGGCLPGNLSCTRIQKNGGYLPFSANGVLMDLKSVIYECGRYCQCPPSCRSRVSQGRLKIRLEVFKTKDKGWGLRSWDHIRAGTFLCEYAGEVMDNARVEKLGSENDDGDIFDSTRSYQQLEIFPSLVILKHLRSHIHSI
ncbi:hypothetical protein K1719_027059 [Acacia pycnantha]|nr:hypothetical protein K1719_027059 [Acacia pycnantha]